MKKSPTPGLYLVTLNNKVPISVNAHDKRHADRCIKVNKKHCKFGRSVNLERRRKDYYRTFGEANVNFFELVTLENIKIAEKAVLEELQQYRISGNTKKKNEWLQNLDAKTVTKIVFAALDMAKIKYRKINS